MLLIAKRATLLILRIGMLDIHPPMFELPRHGATRGCVLHTWDSQGNKITMLADIAYKRIYFTYVDSFADIYAILCRA